MVYSTNYKTGLNLQKISFIRFEFIKGDAEKSLSFRLNG